MRKAIIIFGLIEDDDAKDLMRAITIQPHTVYNFHGQDVNLVLENTGPDVLYFRKAPFTVEELVAMKLTE